MGKCCEVVHHLLQIGISSAHVDPGGSSAMRASSRVHSEACRFVSSFGTSADFANNDDLSVSLSSGYINGCVCTSAPTSNASACENATNVQLNAHTNYDVPRHVVSNAGNSKEEA